MQTSFEDYRTDGFYDELFDEHAAPRAGAELLIKQIRDLPRGEMERRQGLCDGALIRMGVTFRVYNDDESGVDRAFPFDLIPRIVDAREWATLEKGLKQRVRALNLFIHDVYHDQRIVAAGVVPRELIETAAGLRRPCYGLNPPHGIWCHVTGVDLVRDGTGQFYVLEDNLRVPSGVSYVLANRQLMKRTFPEVFSACRVRPVSDYPTHLLHTLTSLTEGLARPVDTPAVAVLTPGPYNSAYFEHSYLAQQTGAELVEGRDLVVADGRLLMRTTLGLRPVDVLYRRIDDDFLDPHEFRADSLLGVPGLMDVYRQGRIAIANAPGTGVADDKVIYAYVPKMIEYYLGEAPVIPNVPTHLCWDDRGLRHTLENLDKLVVKPAGESGGYGMLFGPTSSRSERAEFADRIRENPRNYVAQPVVDLSRAPVVVGEGYEGRHVDLRPFVLYGEEDIYVLPGGLTRVALRKGSMVVNSSQGGGSKDTWVAM